MSIESAGHSPRLVVVDCMVAPQFDGLDLGLRNRIWYDSVGRRVTVEGVVDERDIRQLRACHPSNEWQMVVDELVAVALIDYDCGSSAYPLTKWGLLKSGLAANNAEAWQAFIDDYRKPIAKSIHKILSHRGRRAPSDDADLADGFFSWFYGEQVFNRLSIFSPDGKLNRFRGYLRLCIRTYINQELLGREQAEIEETIPDGEEAEGEIIDIEYCRALVEAELNHWRSEDYASWYALMCDVQNLTLKEVAAHLDASVSGAHRDRQRARERFRERLVQRRLRHTTLSIDDALIEFQQLVPTIAQALKEYGAAHRIDLSTDTFRRARRNMPRLANQPTEPAESDD